MANTTSGTTTFGKNFAIDDIVENFLPTDRDWET